MNQMMQMQCSAACHPAPSFMKVLEQALFIQNERKAIRHLSAAPPERDFSLRRKQWPRLYRKFCSTIKPISWRIYL
jgi:hypothetical protein